MNRKTRNQEIPVLCYPDTGQVNMDLGAREYNYICHLLATHEVNSRSGLEPFTPRIQQGWSLDLKEPFPKCYRSWSWSLEGDIATCMRQT